MHNQPAEPMVELWRGGLLESVHAGHAVICDAMGQIVESWGNPAEIIFPRSSCKMLQALPLMESGAFDAAGLTEAHAAFACASHYGSSLHTSLAHSWLTGLGMGESDLRCGAHEPTDKVERNRLIKADESPCQYHNNCSGKHCGFLTMNRHLKGGQDYTDLDHPLQVQIKQAFEEVTGEVSSGWGIDGCSAPNFATSLHGLARAMAAFAAATSFGDGRDRAMHRLTRAMAAYPELVAGDTSCDTELMRAMDGRVTLKGGAEAVHIAIIPALKLGVAIKIVDGGYRASDAVIAALLVRLGVLDAGHKYTRKRLNAVQTNWRGKETGVLKLSADFL
ncbi:MAG: asparaginase [Alphaproteobacteria bacterium]|jgi:L-asparaginase II